MLSCSALQIHKRYTKILWDKGIFTIEILSDFFFYPTLTTSSKISTIANPGLLQLIGT